jgi:hypothetical protein
MPDNDTPFPRHPDNLFPSLIPDARIDFSGLLILRPKLITNGVRECLVGILKAPAAPHKLNITVKNSVGAIVDNRKIVPPLVIEGAGLGVTKFVSTNGPFERKENDHFGDLRWAIDLKGFHPRSAPEIDGPKVGWDILLRDGLLFVPDEGLTSPADVKAKLTPPGEPEKDINRIAQIVSANIYLNSGNLYLSWYNQGPEKLSLPKRGGSTVAYHIEIEHEPTDSTVHDDLEEHYKGISTTEAHFRLELTKLHADTGVNTPCMPTIFDGEI